MLVTFIGQAMATNTLLPCDSSANPQWLNQSQHYSSEALALKGENQCCDIECCNADCICLSNGCVSFSYLTIDLHTIKPLALYGTLYRYETEQPNSITTTTYRPPILI